MDDIIVKQTYDCPFYKQTVTVSIRKEVCDHEHCSKPQPHITGEYFHSCGDILNCGIGKIVDGRLFADMTLCPAYMSIDIRGEKL